MKLLATIGIASVIALTGIAPVQARQGCGPGFHRNHWGRCVPNRRPGPEVWVVGRYYAGHGYWYRNRWWHHRYRDRDTHEWQYR